MKPRFAEPADKIAVIGLLKQAHAAAGFAFPFQAAYAEQVFLSHTGNTASCCIVLGERPVGVLMARMFSHPFGAGWWAKETVWFVEPAHRGRGSLRMLDAYEDWARSVGCSVIGMASLASNDVSALYRRRGFAPVETHFIKEL